MWPILGAEAILLWAHDNPRTVRPTTGPGMGLAMIENHSLCLLKDKDILVE